ncbi:hypothetical protein [Streptomyces collinus]|uniref:LexA family protein n=1 Tax=Streptomyces collinus TaxID=42684 RepID=UPI003645A04F
MAEIGAAVGMRSRASVHHHLVELETKRAIVRDPGRSRGINSRERRRPLPPAAHQRGPCRAARLVVERGGGAR